MKTIVYVDGYNLYYSLLRKSQYKWLDLFTLFSKILNEQNPKTDLQLVKYFTSPAKAKFATNGSQAPISQNKYHRALLSPRTGNVEIIEGFHTESRATPMRYTNPPNKEDRVHTWKLEEKQTDVNIALNLYRDSSKNLCEQVVVCSADTDIAPALKLIKEDFPHIKMGAIFPLQKTDDERHPIVEIAAQTHWSRSYILEEELANSQFKNRVPTDKKPVDKPDYW